MTNVLFKTLVSRADHLYRIYYMHYSYSTCLCTEGRARESAEELETVRKAAAAEAKALKAQCTNLAQQLKHSEHRVKAKEVVVEKLMAKLHGEVSQRTVLLLCERTLM
jgi:hypothetical protein